MKKDKCPNHTSGDHFIVEGTDKCICGYSIPKVKPSIGVTEKEYHYKYYRKRMRTDPWNVVFTRIRNRCKNPRDRYGKLGIKCFMTADDFKKLWYRDNAFALKRPSIDRIDPDGNYTIDNCRFIELSENSKRARHPEHQFNKRKPFNQYSLDGKFIRRWELQCDAARHFGVDRSTVNTWLLGDVKNGGGYKWEYINDGVHRKRWSLKYSKCLNCGTSKKKHRGHGLCAYCYQKEWRAR